MGDAEKTLKPGISTFICRNFTTLIRCAASYFNPLTNHIFRPAPPFDKPIRLKPLDWVPPKYSTDEHGPADQVVSTQLKQNPNRTAIAKESPRDGEICVG